MFLESSRYYKQNLVEINNKDSAKSIIALSLRRIPFIAGKPRIVKSNDKLDIISQQLYDDPTMFWHIADANTELWSHDLIKKTSTVKIVMVPET